MPTKRSRLKREESALDARKAVEEELDRELEKTSAEAIRRRSLAAPRNADNL
jgi:hypothetical protein